MKTTQTAFYVLGASLHSTRAEIHRLAEEKMLLIDEEQCRNARRELSQTNLRIPHEIAWLPGVEPACARSLAELAAEGRLTFHYSHRGQRLAIPPLALCNLIAEHLAQAPLFSGLFSDEGAEAEHIESLLRTAAELCEEVDSETVQDELNAARERAGFNTIPSCEMLDEHLANQRGELRNAFAAALRSLPKETETAILTRLMEQQEEEDDMRLSLLDDVVADYELSRMPKLTELETTIAGAGKKVKEEMKRQKGAGNGGVEISTEELERISGLVVEWHAIIHPVLLSCKGRGVAHRRAEELVGEIRACYFDALKVYNCGNVFRILVPAVSFAADCIPKFNHLVTDDLNFLHNGFEAKEQIAKLRALCKDCEKKQESKSAILETFQQFKEIIETHYPAGALSHEASDWVALQCIGYAAALTNKFNDDANARDIFAVAASYAKSQYMQLLVQNNLNRITANKQHREKCAADEDEKERQATEQNLKAKAANKRKSIVALVAAILACICAFMLHLYVHGEEYELKYVSSLGFEGQATYLRMHPDTACKQYITEMMAGTLLRLTNMRAYKRFVDKVPKDALDEDTLLTVFEKCASLDQLSYFTYMCPHAKPSSIEKVKRIEGDIAERAWNAIPKPYTDEAVEQFLAVYAGIISRETIDQRIEADIRDATDTDYLIKYASTRHAASANRRIEELELSRWEQEGKAMENEVDLQAFKKSLKSDGVRDMVDKHIAEVDEKHWEERKGSFTTPEEIRGYAKKAATASVKKKAEQAAQEMEMQQWQAVKASVLNPRELLKFRDSVQNTALKDDINARIEEIEVQNWQRGQKELKTPDDLRAYKERTVSLRVLLLVNERLDTLEWQSRKKELTTVGELVAFRQGLRTESVIQSVDARIEELERKNWEKDKKGLHRLSEISRYRASLHSEAVRKLVDELYNEVSLSFSHACEVDTRAAYERFISHSSNRKEIEQAKKRLVDLEVRDIAAARHSYYPADNHASYRRNNSGYASIEIENATSYTITVMYSGPDSTKVSVPARQTRKVRIKSGSYKVAVTTEQPNILPFYGSSDFSSGSYSEEFYIQTSYSRY